jgi:hypothetical protein
MPLKGGIPQVRSRTTAFAQSSPRPAAAYQEELDLEGTIKVGAGPVKQTPAQAYANGTTYFAT